MCAGSLTGVSGVVGGCGVVVWLLHSGREHLVRMTPLVWGVVFMYVIFSTQHNQSSLFLFWLVGLLVVWVVFVAHESMVCICVCKLLRAYGGCLGIRSR